VSLLISGYAGIQSGNETALKEIIYSKGPVSASMHATKRFEVYKEGIFYDAECKGELYFHNHAILIVGYGTNNNGIDYYIIKV
jgi:cathepsin L